MREMVINNRDRWQGIADNEERGRIIWGNVLSANIVNFGLTRKNQHRRPCQVAKPETRNEAHWSIDWRDMRRTWRLLKPLRKRADNLPPIVLMADDTIVDGPQAADIKLQCMRAAFSDPKDMYPMDWLVTWPTVKENIDTAIANLPIPTIDVSLMYNLQTEDLLDLRSKLNTTLRKILGQPFESIG